ncbi:CDP-alcohol phosphatidyltransferase family protein [Microlunatus soli]|uniref:CDP-alcohol phosphatidyltransferase family protein n=1 Tax=Microlunatus soli TaxID=630515 RepID=UPI0012FA0FD6|nr:CDP-alcohol phosphatidyltransferase family protein [Microlunatus soli]
MNLTSELVVLRPLVIGAVITAFGALMAAAPAPAGLGLLGYLAAALLVHLGWKRSRLGLHRFGLANIVTLARLVGTGWILALLIQAVWVEPTAAIAITAAVIATICLILDGVDGRIARHRGETSSFGARFDIETDSATTLILTFTLVVFDIAGWWVIIIGALRYAYLLAAAALPALRQPLPFSQARRVIGLGQAVLLVISLLVAGMVPAAAASGWLALLPAVGLAALLWSFGRDAWGQLRHRDQ